MDYLAYVIAQGLTYGVLGFLVLLGGLLALGLFNSFFDRGLTRAQRVQWDQASPSFFRTHWIALSGAALFLLVTLIGTALL
jgi:hypothetical protein